MILMMIIEAKGRHKFQVLGKDDLHLYGQPLTVSNRITQTLAWHVRPPKIALCSYNWAHKTVITGFSWAAHYMFQDSGGLIRGPKSTYLTALLNTIPLKWQYKSTLLAPHQLFLKGFSFSSSSLSPLRQHTDTAVMAALSLKSSNSSSSSLRHLNDHLSILNWVVILLIYSVYLPKYPDFRYLQLRSF